MMDKIDDMSVVEALRTKTEELDMDNYLKSKLGGYTKQSVLEYLNILRKQQQTTAETFYSNLQTIYNEKEAIKKTNEALQYRLNTIESEYKNLSESMKTINLEGSDFTMQDILSLKSKSAALAEELKKNKIEKISLENKIEQQNNCVNELTEKLNQAEHEIAAVREMFITEKQESTEQRDKVAELSIIIEGKMDEIKYLKALQSEGQLAELTSNINSLTNQLITQTEVMANLNAEVNLKHKTIETLTGETKLQKQSINDLNKMSEETQNQNEKLLLANKTLTKQLEDDYKKTIDLINEKSNITIDKLIALRKLDEANSRIALLELKLQKSTKAEELKSKEFKS